MIYSKILQEKIKRFYGENSLIYAECKMRNGNLPLLIRKSLDMRENLELGSANLLYIIENSQSNEEAVAKIQTIASLCRQEKELFGEVEKERKEFLHKACQKRCAIQHKLCCQKIEKEL